MVLHVDDSDIKPNFTAYTAFTQIRFSLFPLFRKLQCSNECCLHVKRMVILPKVDPIDCGAFKNNGQKLAQTVFKCIKTMLMKGLGYSCMH